MLATLYNTLRPGGSVRLFFCFDCIHLRLVVRGGKEDRFLNSLRCQALKPVPSKALNSLRGGALSPLRRKAGVSTPAWSEMNSRGLHRLRKNSPAAARSVRARLQSCRRRPIPTVGFSPWGILLAHLNSTRLIFPALFSPTNRQATGGEGKSIEIKEKDSSPRSRGRKSGNPSEEFDVHPLGCTPSFLNPARENQEFWKTIFNSSPPCPGFPRLPQEAEIGLCKARVSCAEQAHTRSRQGVAAFQLSTNYWRSSQNPRARSEASQESITLATSDRRADSQPRFRAPVLPIPAPARHKRGCLRGLEILESPKLGISDL